MFADFLISGYMLVALNAPSIFPLRNTSVLEPGVSAKSVLILDIKRDKVLFEKASTTPLPMASLAKLLSSLVVLDTMSLDKGITISDQAVNTLGDAGDFKVGERVQARHLLFASLISSSNDALMALAYEVGLENFLSLERSKLIQLGVKKVFIADPVGLLPQTSASAIELAKIAKAAFSNDFLRGILSIPEYSFTSASGMSHKLISTNDLIFDPRIVAGKTGSLKEVGQNYAALVKGGEGDEKLLVVLMGSSHRAKDMVSLLNWLDKGFTWR